MVLGRAIFSSRAGNHLPSQVRRPPVLLSTIMLRPGTSRVALHILCGAVCAVIASGCASWQLPRIDPSGQSLFIWPNQAPLPIAVAAPSPAIPVGAPVPAPAVAAPLPTNIQAAPVYPDVPTAPLAPGAAPVLSTISNPLTPTIVGPPVAVTSGPPGSSLAQPVSPAGAIPIGVDHLRITPDRVMAPIGSEVVLKAGICAADGYLLTDRRVEWSLSRDGAGHFVDIGERGEVDLFRWPWDTPRKIDNWYAIGSTSYAPYCVHRGTPDASDDVQVVRGEAWITVSSAAEGTSHVTAVAPDVANWQFRQATATIYWIDAQWIFPPSTQAEPGRPHVLTTTIMRRSDGTPLAGWTVRYDVPGGGASLGYASGSHVDVTADANGRASVEVSPNDVGGGSATIGMTIIRPPLAGLQPSPQLEIARGQATITWGSGQAPTPIASGPALQPTPAQPSPPPPSGSAATQPYTPPPAAATTGPPRLEVRVTNVGPEAVSVGEFVSFDVSVTNRGDSPARNILIYDRFDTGLSHEEDRLRRNAIEYGEMPDLAPGEPRTVALTFRVIAAGRQCHQVTVSADGAAPVTAEPACVVGRQASLQVRLDSVLRQVVGQPVEFRINVRNVSDVPATNIEITQQFAPALQPVPAADQQLAPDGSIRIRIDRLNPNELRQFITQARCVSASASACSRATVSAEGGVAQPSDACLEIVQQAP
jgi:uncharacterized repeat protein (TIGR01451 family)